MNIDGLRLYSAATESVGAVSIAEFSLDAADLSQSYILQSVTGLDVDEIIPQFYGTYEGDAFYNMTLKPRTVVMRIRLNPQYNSAETPSDLRDALYRVISANRTSKVEIRLMYEGSPVAFVQGYIRKVEASLFEATTEVQLTIECPFPFLRGVSYVELEGDAGVSVPSPTLIDDLSTAPHGFKMELAITGTLSSLTIQGKSGTTEWPFEVMQSFASGDDLFFSSEPDDKYLYRVRSGVTLLLADKLTVGSVWPLMFPGETEIAFGTSSLTIESITYRPHYWGV